MNFDTAFAKVIVEEGGYLSAADAAAQGDPGGETKFGISKRSYPGEDIANMTVERSKTIYARDYWGPACCDAVPDPVKYPLFSMAVNSGVKTAIKALQMAVQTDVDGVVGPHTLMAMQSMDPQRIVTRLAGARLQILANCKNWPVAGRGWTLRVAGELLEA